MSQKFEGGLNDMLQNCDSAKQYFMTLPEHVQGMIVQRSGNITSERDLIRYAENLLQGDK